MCKYIILLVIRLQELKKIDLLTTDLQRIDLQAYGSVNLQLKRPGRRVKLVMTGGFLP